MNQMVHIKPQLTIYNFLYVKLLPKKFTVSYIYKAYSKIMNWMWIARGKYI